MARSFNGTTDFIDCGTGSALNPAAITVLAWVKVNLAAIAINYVGIATRGSAGDATDGDYFLYVQASGQLAVYVNMGGGAKVIDPSTNSITTNTWSSVGFSAITGGGVIAYVNGVASGTAASASPFSTTNVHNFIIGNDPTVANRFVPGSIAEVCVWNTVLSPAQITLFNNGTRGSDILPASLKGYWCLDGLLSPEPDSSGSGNNGALTGTSLDASGPPIIPFHGMRMFQM